MTTPIIPSSIVQLFANEVYKINLQIIETICKKYNLDQDDVKKTLKKEMNLSIKIIPQEEQKFKLVKRRMYNKDIPQESKCIGRVYHQDDNEFTQCRRKMSDTSSCLCRQHQQKLPWGTINDPEPVKEVRRRGLY